MRAPETAVAIQAHLEEARAKDLLARKRHANRLAYLRVPSEDHDWYMQQTQAIDDKMEAKRAARPGLYGDA